MKVNHSLTSEQALTDYFASLLDDTPALEDTEIAQKIINTNETESDIKLTNNKESVKISEKKLVDNINVKGNLTDSNLAVDFATSLEVVQELNKDPLFEKKAQTDVKTENKEKLERLLGQVAVFDKPQEEIQEWSVESNNISKPVEPELVEIVNTVQDLENDKLDLVQDNIEQKDKSADEWKNISYENDFQVLYFKVMGIRFAVPLVELGGIQRLEEKLSHLLGRPNWYLGMQLWQEEKYDVVDTATWILPENLTLEDGSTNYKYLILLGTSSWGLACDMLEGTEQLSPNMVNWRQSAGKRPWLAGIVKEKMCALIHVEALVKILKAGLDVNQAQANEC